MKRIHFENLTWNWSRISLIIIALLSFIIGFGLVLDYKNSLITIIGFLTIIFLASKRLWYKYYVEYNKFGILIKLNTITNKTINFNEIDKIKINDNSLIVELKSERNFDFKITDINNSDSDKLLRILVENSKSEFTDDRNALFDLLEK